MSEQMRHATALRLAGVKLAAAAERAVTDLKEQAVALEIQAGDPAKEKSETLLTVRAVLRAMNNVMPIANGTDPGIDDVLVELGFGAMPDYVRLKQREWASDPARALLRMDAETFGKFLAWCLTRYHD